MRESIEGTGGLDLLENHKAIGFLSNTVTIVKLPRQHSMVLGDHRPTSDMPFNELMTFHWRADDTFIPSYRFVEVV